MVIRCHGGLRTSGSTPAQIKAAILASNAAQELIPIVKLASNIQEDAKITDAESVDLDTETMERLGGIMEAEMSFPGEYADESDFVGISALLARRRVKDMQISTSNGIVRDSDHFFRMQLVAIHGGWSNSMCQRASKRGPAPL